MAYIEKKKGEAAVSVRCRREALMLCANSEDASSDF